MRRLSVALMSALVLSASPALHSPAGAQTDTRSAENAFVAKIGALRASKGLPALAVHAELTDIGRRWAGVMADADRIYHNANLAQEVTADWLKLGENVGVGGSVDSLHDAFVASPAHYKNLVDPDFTHIGVGVVTGRDGVLYTAHQFMKLAGRAAPAPTAAPAPSPDPITSAEPKVTAPPTTRAPRPATTQAAKPAPVPRPAPVPTPEAEPVAVPEPGPAPEPPALPAPPRGVVLLDLLRALDSVS